MNGKLLIGIIALLAAAQAAEPLAFGNKGELAAFTVVGQNLVAASTNARLFAIGARDTNGREVIIGSETGAFAGDARSANAHELYFASLGGVPLDARVKVRFDEREGRSFWRIALDNRSELRLEWVEFPCISVPNDLRDDPKGPAIFWPGNEGCLVTDADFRKRHGQAYQPQGYPSGGWCGRYPGAVQMPFMAYLRHGAGLYLGAHDPHFASKEIDYVREGNRVRLVMKLYLAGAGRGEWKMDYDIVLGAIGTTRRKSIARGWSLNRARVCRRS